MLIIESYIKKLHQKDESFVELVATGASSTLQSLFAAVPGCSNTLLNATFPYDRGAFEEYIDNTWDMPFVSEEAAGTLAAHAWRNGMRKSWQKKIHPDHIIGLAVTGSIDPGRPKKGGLGAWIALRTPQWIHYMQIIFPKNIAYQENPNGTSVFGRELENDLCDFFAISMILEYFEIDSLSIDDFKSTGYPEGLPDWIKKTLIIIPSSNSVNYEYDHTEHDVVYHLPNGTHTIEPLDLDEYFLLPTSANPLHAGHEIMADVVRKCSGRKPLFIIETKHPLKGDLGNKEIYKRTLQFRFLHPVAVTSGLGTYVEMGKVFPNTPIAIGIDNMSKIFDETYLNGKRYADELKDLDSNGTTFFVFDRDGESYNDHDLAIILSRVPDKYQRLFNHLRSDIPIISSSEIRNMKK